MKENRHLLLLISILALFIFTPLVVTMHQGVLLLNVIAAIVLVSGTYAMGRNRSLFVIAIVLSILSVAATWLMVFHSSHAAVLCWLGCLLFLSAFLAAAILRYVFQIGRVTSDKIYAAICVFMLIGYAWTFAYSLLEEIEPGSFRISAEIEPHDYASRVSELRYFSFITLTTLGYGDVVPRSQMARTMAAIEAVMGQIYLAVLVARLVGMHILHATTQDDRE